MSSPNAAATVSVVLCTFNPKPALLDWALNSVRNQTATPDDIELVLVDNNSEPPVSLEGVRSALPGIRSRVVREPMQGLIHARLCGIRSTLAPLIVFLDDDNHLDADYLQVAQTIARENPHIGCFGGKADGVVESKLPGWKRELLPYLGVRDYGPEPITSNRDEWGQWEPIGAGMVCRREVAEEFCRLVESKINANRLGRAGANLMSGEDSLIAHAAYRLGFSCSYQPALRISHWMGGNRLTFRNLARTVAGHGRSHAVLQTVKGRLVPKPHPVEAGRRLIRRYYEHVRNDGLGAGTVKWCWELGYVTEARRVGS